MNTKITKKTQYAVAAMLELARSGDVMPVSVISNSQSVDHDYMSIILGELKKQKLVESTRGVKGGYRLAKPLEEISISNIMDAVGENLKVTRCHGKGNCTGTSSKCLAHKMWQGLEEQTARYLASVTLRDVIDSANTEGL